jgi:serine phosphatase RsbU (regulator of sigma subunit)
VNNSASDRRYQILIVDDIEDNRFTLDIMLSVLGDFDIDEAESGPEALSMMGDKAYDLVLLDIMMPGMTGLEVLEKLDLANAQSSTKIIVVSALQDMETIVKALELGALDYLPKPIEESLLAARLKQLIERQKTDDELEHHRARIDADLKKAAEIQLSLCPKESLQISSGEATFEFAGTMRSAYEVGGDFFDYFSLPNGNVVFAIADACGKGAPAAIYATRVHDLLRLIARTQDVSTQSHPECSLLHMVNEVNAVLCEHNEDCWFVTAWIGVLVPGKRQISWCSAGHCEALLQDADGSIQTLSSKVGFPLGLEETFDGEVKSIDLKTGSIVHVYTDGITEHRKENGDFLGIDGLQEILKPAIDAKSHKQLVNEVADAVKAVNSQKMPEDDVTLLSLKFS